MAFPHNFILDESLTAGWDLLKKSFWKYFCMVGLAGFLSFLPDFAKDGVKYCVQDNQQWIYATLLFFGGLLIKGLMQLGLINIQLRILDDKPFTSNDLWTPCGKFWAWFGATTCAIVAIAVGFCLFIVPGVILGIKLQFFPYFLVDKRLGPIQSLKASAAITSGAMWDLFFLGLILGFLKAVSFCLFMIGVIPAHMLSELTMTHVYRSLLSHADSEKFPFLAVEKPVVAE